MSEYLAWETAKLQAAVARLESLQADGIAAELHQRQYTGTPGMKSENPLGRYLADILSLPWEAIEVSAETINANTGTGRIRVNTPDALATFVTRFTDEQYSELIDESNETETSNEWEDA